MALTASAILRIQLKAEQMWKDSRLMAEYKANTDTAKAVLANQSARFVELTDKGKEDTVRVMWLDPCSGTVDDCTPTCDISGNPPSTNSQDYALNLCKETVFSINEETARNNEYSVEEQTAQQLLLAKKRLDEWWSQQLLLQMKAYANKNFWLNGWTYANGTTYVPDANYNVTLLPYLIRAAIMNKMPDYYAIEDGELFDALTLAGLNAQNLNGQGAAEMAKQIQSKTTLDMWNFAAAGLTEDLFILSRGAIAFKTKSRFTTQPVYEDGTTKPQWRYSIASDNLPGVDYEVYHQKSCVVPNGASQEQIVHNYKLKTRGGIFLNPLGCSVTLNGVTGQSSGIISLTKGVVPS